MITKKSYKASNVRICDRVVDQSKVRSASYHTKILFDSNSKRLDGIIKWVKFKM